MWCLSMTNLPEIKSKFRLNICHINQQGITPNKQILLSQDIKLIQINVFPLTLQFLKSRNLILTASAILTKGYLLQNGLKNSSGNNNHASYFQIRQGL
jgi:hypothetical protein